MLIPASFRKRASIQLGKMGGRVILLTMEHFRITRKGSYISQSGIILNSKNLINRKESLSMTQEMG